MIGPNLPIDSNALAISGGRTSENTFDPSRGGIGRRLNIAKRTLVFTIVERIKMEMVRASDESDDEKSVIVR